MDRKFEEKEKSINRMIEIKEYANKNHIPIIKDESLSYILNIFERDLNIFKSKSEEEKNKKQIKIL